MKPSHLLLAGALLALAVPDARPQFGTLTPAPYPINLTGITGGLQCFGVCRTQNAAGVVRIWVSAQAPAVGVPHRLFELNAAGAVVAIHNQPTVRGAGNPIGIRDLAWAGGALIYGGQELAVAPQIHCFDINALAWVAPIPVMGAVPPVLQALVAVPGGNFFTANGTGNVYPINVAGGVGVLGAAMASGFADITGAGFDPVENRLFWFSNGAAGMDYDPARAWGVVVADARWCGGAYTYLGNAHYGNGGWMAGGFLGGRSGGMDADRLGGGGTLRGLLVQKAANDWLVEIELELNRGLMCANCGPVCGAGHPAGLEMAGATGFVSPSPAFAMGLRNASCAVGGPAVLLYDAGVGVACPFLLVGAGPYIAGVQFVGAGGGANFAFPIPGGLPTPLPVAFQAHMLPPAGGVVSSRAAFVEIR